MTFSEQIVYGLIKPSKYKEILNLRARRGVLYIVVLMLVLGIVSFAIPTAALITGFGGFENLFTKNISSLEYSDGELSIEKPFKMSFDYNNILIDTSVENITDNMLEKDGIYYAFGSKTLRMSYVYDSQIIDYQIFNLEYLLPEGLNNAMLCDYIPGIYAYLVIAFLIICLGFFIKYAAISLIFSIMVNSMNKRLEMGLSFGKVFLLCFYGQSFSMILSNFNSALGLFPSVIVSTVGIFVSVNIITAALSYIHKGNQA